MADQDATSVRQTADAIRVYLRAHPRAADNAAGVAKWWLGGGAAGAPDVVEAALRLLAREGIVREETLPDGRTFYRAAFDGFFS